MCGIWLSIDGGGAKRALELMVHRGPDAQVSESFDVAGRVIEMGHARLSIIDLDPRANQPMHYRDHLVVVFNGEIYNYVELREELARLGHAFKTSSDTEVLLAAYAAWGADMPPRLRGMFAFALLDRRERRLVLARDPFGIKPLFWARTTHGIAAASEIAPLLDMPGVSRRGNAAAAIDFLRHGASDAGARTFLEDVLSLPAAHYAVIALDDRQLPLEPKRYWRPTYDASITDRGEATRLVRERFLDSVGVHLRADVPLGTMLSGGIDSSAIVAGMRHLLGPAAELHSFSFVSPGDPLDESHFIRLMSGEARTISHEVTADAETFTADIDRLVRCQGEPFGSTSIYAQYRVASAAREAGIKVLLDGQGSDELFAGYRFFIGARIAGLMSAGEPLRAARVLMHAARQPGVKLPAAIYHTLASLDLPGARQIARAAEARSGADDIIAPEWRAASTRPEHGRAMPRRLALLERLEASLLHDVLPGLLRFEDRNTMAFSIEARVPFLDVPLAEVACRLAPELLVDDQCTTKSVLREALRGLVPDAILDRRDKIGFATPEARWLRSAAGWVEGELAASRNGAPPFLKADRLANAIGAMLAQKRAWQPWAWRSLSLLAWTRAMNVHYAGVAALPREI